MKKLLAYLQNNKHLLNIKQLESAAKIPTSTLDKFIKEERDLNSRHAMNLIETLIKIGGGVFQLGNTMFKMVSDHQEFEAFEIVSTSEAVEVKMADGIHFEYSANLSREKIYDDVDLLMYL
jgi:hypothetical protein